MGWKFNPFTGALDQTGSTPASYIDGEVATYNDLPLSSTTAPLDTAWLVRGSSGVWPFTKPGGVYIRTATGGSSRDADYTYAGVFPDVFADNQLTVYSASDTSRLLKFNLSGIPTATTRTVDAPTGSGRMLVEGQSIGSTTAAAGTFTSLKADSLILPSTGAPLIYLNTSSGQVSASSFSAGSYTTSSGGSYTVASGGSLVFNSGATVSGQVVASNGTITAAAPVLDLSQTWNNAAVTFTGVKLNVSATAAASNSMFADVQAGGYSQFGIARISSTSNAVWLYNTNSGTNTNGVGANYERLFLRWSSNVAQIGTEKAGTGSARALEFQTDGTSRLTVGTDGRVGIGTAPSTHLVNISGAVNSGFSAQLTNTGTNPEGWAILLPNISVASSRAIFYGGTALSARNGFGLNFFNAGSGSTSNRIAFSFNAVDDIFILRADRRAGINTTAPDRALEINDASGGCLRLTHNDNNGSATNFCDMTVASDGVTTIAPSGSELVITKNVNIGTRNIVTDAATGTRIGTATTQLLGFWNAAPSAQPAAVADATDAASTQARLNDLLARLRTIGIIAT